jgi:excisionase family DNA binding protein
VTHIIDLNKLVYIKHVRIIMIADELNYHSAVKKTFKEIHARDDNTSIEDLFMEKICIVRRRIQNPVLQEQMSFSMDKEGATLCEVPDIRPVVSDGNGRQHISPFRSAIKDDDHIIRIQLTPDQCKVVQSNGCLDHFLGKIIGNIDLELEHYEDGQIVFNVHLKQVKRADMLDSKKVCQMLQISKSFLARLTRTERIKSYKLGRLRRFLLTDILEYLSQSEMLFTTKEKSLKKVSDIFIKEQLDKQPVS